jgi:hypothetical protein
MVLKVGDQVVPIHLIDLWSDSELTYLSGEFKRGELAVVIETVVKRGWFDGDTIYARVLTSGGSTGWCSSRFFIDLLHYPLLEDPQ